MTKEISVLLKTKTAKEIIDSLSKLNESEKVEIRKRFPSNGPGRYQEILEKTTQMIKSVPIRNAVMREQRAIDSKRRANNRENQVADPLRRRV
jgi:hypothetical protein